jgi:hypothetical protein
MASLAGADQGLEFASGHLLDPEGAGQIIGRFLDDGDLQKLHRTLIKAAQAIGRSPIWTPTSS